MTRMIDLHIHTTASDGTDTPSQVVSLASELDLAAIAITDHDTVDGLAEAENAAIGQALEVIRGCELSVHTDFGEVHVLGLWLPYDLGPLDACLEMVRAKRNVRNELIVDKLGALGVALPYQAVLDEAQGDVVGRPHIARALVRHGFVRDEREAFSRYLRGGAAAYVPRQTLPAREGVRLLKHLGATVAVAHPLLARCSRSTMEQTVTVLREEGLDVLEVWHSEQSPADTEWLQKLARRLDLGVTGGSDYHGSAKPHVHLGVSGGGLTVSERVLDDLKTRRVRQGLPV